MLETRVGRLEEDVREIRGDIKQINLRLGRIEERMARMEGGFEAIRHRLDAMPTITTHVVSIITAVGGSVAAVVAVAAFLGAPG